MVEQFVPSAIQFVLFDIAGTTVSDGQPGSSVVVETLAETLREAGVDVDTATITLRRGRDHRETIRELLQEGRGGAGVAEVEVEEWLQVCLGKLDARASELVEIPGAADTFRFLRARGIRVGVGSGFPRELVERIVARFGWRERGLIDYAESTETVGEGRPAPAMIRAAMARFQVSDPRHVLKVGDTIADVHEGRNAGAWTAAVLTGTQGRAALEAERPDFVLDSVADLPSLFGSLEPAGARS